MYVGPGKAFTKADADPALSQLRTERLITCRQTAPKWIRKFLGGGDDVSHVLETSYVDPVAKKVTMCSQNMTWSDLITCHETVVYRPSASHPLCATTFSQRAEIVALCGGWQNIKNKIEDVSVSQFRQNAIRGRQGFEAVLEMSRRVFADERRRNGELQRA